MCKGSNKLVEKSMGNRGNVWINEVEFCVKNREYGISTKFVDLH